MPRKTKKPTAKERGADKPASSRPGSPQPHTQKEKAAKSDASSATPPRPGPSEESKPSSEPAAGLDAAQHAAAQRAAHQADGLRTCVIPAMMASAFPALAKFSPAAFKVHLEQTLADLGNPTDPVERMLIEQLVLAHFRVAQLHVDAGYCKGAEGMKLYTAATARLLGEFRRTALALRAYGTTTPESRSDKNVKLFKAAQ
jgi:hypothetical protein